MNITYLIGNGFDLNLGMKTRFSDFYKYYLTLESSEDVIKAFKSELKENLENWSDLEVALGEYAEKFTKRSENDFITLLDDIQDALADYIDMQDVDFSISDNDRNKFHNDLMTPEHYLSLREQEEFSEFKKHISASHFVANVIMFNYTRSFERLSGWSNAELNIGSRVISSTRFNNTIKSVEHIHGTTSADMILGVNDPSQIHNDELSKSIATMRAMVKTEINVNAGTLRDRRCDSFIANADLICIFGMSLGITDKHWWEVVVKRLLTSNARLIIFSRANQINPRRSYRARNVKDEIISNLLSHIKLSDSERTKVEKQIFVCINSNMFSVKAIPPVQENLATTAAALSESPTKSIKIKVG